MEQRCYPAGTVLGVDFSLSPEGALVPEADEKDPVHQDPALHSVLSGKHHQIPADNLCVTRGMLFLSCCWCHRRLAEDLEISNIEVLI